MGAKTVFLITVLTTRMIMPGMPSMPNIPGMKMPGIGSPARTLTMDLTSDMKAGEKSKAECAIPDGLKLGPRVKLDIDLPASSVESSGTDEKTKPGKAEEKKFTIKTYWGCAEKVPSGQPMVLDSDKIAGQMGKAGMDMDFTKMMKSSAVDAAFENGSHAYWPGFQKGEIAEDADTPGSYELNTNYCGDTSITFSKAQNFLEPVEIVSPGKKAPDLEKTIKLEWKSIPNAEAYILSAMSGSEDEMVIWTSSSDPKIGRDFQSKAISKDELDGLIDKGILLPASKTSCRIPAGIFKDTGAPTIIVTAIGTDKIQDKDGIETRVVVRSTAMLMLSKGMGDDEDQAVEEENNDNDKTEVEESSDDDSGDAVDKANDAADKVDRVKDTVNRIGNIFKR